MPPPAPQLDRLLADAEAQPLAGWDFSALGARITTLEPAWDYAGLVLARARHSPDLLDLGTGGGEWLSRLPDRPPRTVATESWPPNVRVAAHRLRPHGVPVLWAEGAPDNVEQVRGVRRGRLPVRSGSFHLVVSRHESFLAAEVARVLAPGGRFVTQQVGSVSRDAHRLLGLRPPAAGPEWTLRYAAGQLESAGLRIAGSGEGERALTFADAGALAWYLRKVSWVVPGFSVAAHRDRLAALHERIAVDGPVRLRQPAFWLEALA